MISAREIKEFDQDDKLLQIDSAGSGPAAEML